MFLALLAGVSLLGIMDTVHAAGSCAGIERGESCGAEYVRSVEAQTLHLQPGEEPRDKVWGAGMIEEHLVVDVVVAGGGSAGTAAALAAARNGATVVLVNGRPVLGGNAGSEIRTTMAGACGVRAGIDPVQKDNGVECREGGIVEEYQLDNAVNNPDLVAELFSMEMYTLMRAEPNLTLFQNTWLVGVTRSDDQAGAEVGTITSAILENQDSQRRYLVKAKVFIDATGDGRLGAEAGAEWIQGREGYSAYNESLAKLGFYRTADDGPDHETEGTSIDFEAEAKPEASQWRAPFWASKFNKSQFQYRGVTGDTAQGFWWNEVSYPYNTVTDGEQVTEEATANILGIWDYLKNSGDHPESANMGLTWVGTVGCKREGRRFVGQYVQNQNDVMKVDMLCTRKPPWCPPKPNHTVPTKVQEPELYWDRVAYAGWPFDLHNPKGMRDPDHPPFTSHKMPFMFSTPLRSLISKDLDNLFFAGRLASFSHVVYGSQRVMRTCAVMGQAAGTAAAYAVTHNLNPNQLKDRPGAVWSIQQQLLRDDSFIIGTYNNDPRDYARTATVTATSEWANATAIEVISGQTRSVVTSAEGVTIGSGGGVPASQAKNGTNRWISVGLPAALTLALPQASALKQAHLVFDTGMYRRLSFSPMLKTSNPDFNWGPQPETVRDYIIEGYTAAADGDKEGGSWKVLCNVTGNYQRRRVHTLPCPEQPPSPNPGPPVKPIVAPGSVLATTCNVTSPLQRWLLTPAGQDPGGGSGGGRRGSGGIFTVQSVNKMLCLGFDDNTSAYGGRGNSVVARPCGSGSIAWNWTEAVGGSFLQTRMPHPSCSGFPGQAVSCECVHPVECTACHGADVYTPPTAVELTTCDAGSHMDWSSLAVNDGRGGPAGGGGGSSAGVLLMTGGLCLEAPQSSYGTVTAAAKGASQGGGGGGGRGPAPPQRVQAKSDADRAAEAAPAPVVTKVRVTVTGTNGIADARINEIRLYDADGVKPFPTQPETARQ